MEMDLSKLTPAPWESRPGFGEVVGPWAEDMNRRMQVCTQDRVRPSSQPDFAFIALARNAFDVMMRRKWGVRVTMVGWNISNTLGMMPNDGGFNYWLNERDWTDPFTALVEADKWYAENVEHKPERTTP